MGSDVRMMRAVDPINIGEKFQSAMEKFRREGVCFLAGSITPLATFGTRERL